MDEALSITFKHAKSSLWTQSWQRPNSEHVLWFWLHGNSKSPELLWSPGRVCMSAHTSIIYTAQERKRAYYRKKSSDISTLLTSLRLEFEQVKGGREEGQHQRSEASPIPAKKNGAKISGESILEENRTGWWTKPRSIVWGEAAEKMVVSKKEKKMDGGEFCCRDHVVQSKWWLNARGMYSGCWKSRSFRIDNFTRHLLRVEDASCWQFKFIKWTRQEIAQQAK